MLSCHIRINRILFNINFCFPALLFGGQLEKAPGPNQSKYIGCIDPQCDIVSVIQDAYENARFLCDQYYLASPDLIIKTAQHNGKSLLARFPILTDLNRCVYRKFWFVDLEPENLIKIVYVPSHLYHMLFELFKNSMRAVLEYHGSSIEKYPPICVTISKGKEDICLKVRTYYIAELINIGMSNKCLYKKKV